MKRKHAVVDAVAVQPVDPVRAQLRGVEEVRVVQRIPRHLDRRKRRVCLWQAAELADVATYVGVGVQVDRPPVHPLQIEHKVAQPRRTRRVAQVRRARVHMVGGDLLRGAQRRAVARRVAVDHDGTGRAGVERRDGERDAARGVRGRAIGGVYDMTRALLCSVRVE